MAATKHPGNSLMSQYSIVLPKRQATDSSGKPIPACDPDQCAAAIKGEGVPVDLSSFWHRRAVIRGIRDSLQFATSPAIIELCSGDDGQAHQFSRARNARLIMSDIIPDMQNPATQPYCIWYPELASEETYREVARQYPSMRYQIGRACAAACYTDLYKELDLLPDVSIAEESREVDKDAEIYKIIMSAHQRYIVMEDFSRSVHLETPRTPAFLNGDMKPRWALGQRVHPGKNLLETTADDIDIEEDGFIGLQDISLKDISGVEDYAKLGPGQSNQLWMPLPPDLPVLEKRLQTQMAAWEGNVDRYSRLMHPRRLRTKIEYNCVLRGIYHSTTFARWWAYQLETNPRRAILPGKLLGQGNEWECREIRTAINARMIMNNDISGVDDDSDCLPWVIWGPVKPSENTLTDLVRKCPSMGHQIAVTCITCDYESIFRSLKPPYTKSLYVAARRSENPFYRQYLEEIMKEHDITPPDFHDFKDFDYTAPGLQTDLEPRDALTDHTVSYYDMEIGYGQYPCGNEHEETPGTYGGGLAKAGRVERYMWLSTETAQKLKDELEVLYEGADTGLLYGDDELHSKLSRRIQPMHW
ncbi:hypothetical protein N7536_009182 [Penicillium majusculum]|uniref:Uncharacterized protein n=1 Tax=Penicillium solitum TaxID=60172 RepID=A0A1V6R377_9EURO|nr:uncharacterized protein PENSOL_c018G07379 [Penicillium solitum]KAJ5686563.1 hypothetical protein N7536_009182 [Penicillium majusculum]OQD95875.1 hypothetical protein PENSOL_c018G07379 [Penicillium solitum]